MVNQHAIAMSWGRHGSKRKLRIWRPDLADAGVLVTHTVPTSPFGANHTGTTVEAAHPGARTKRLYLISSIVHGFCSVRTHLARGQERHPSRLCYARKDRALTSFFNHCAASSIRRTRC